MKTHLFHKTIIYIFHKISIFVNAHEYESDWLNIDGSLSYNLKDSRDTILGLLICEQNLKTNFNPIQRDQLALWPQR